MCTGCGNWIKQERHFVESRHLSQPSLQFVQTRTDNRAAGFSELLSGTENVISISFDSWAYDESIIADVLHIYLSYYWAQSPISYPSTGLFYFCTILSKFYPSKPTERLPLTSYTKVISTPMRERTLEKLLYGKTNLIFELTLSAFLIIP